MKQNKSMLQGAVSIKKIKFEVKLDDLEHLIFKKAYHKFVIKSCITVKMEKREDFVLITVNILKTLSNLKLIYISVAFKMCRG